MDINLTGMAYVPRLKKSYDLSKVSNHIRLMVDATKAAGDLKWFGIDMETYLTSDIDTKGHEVCVGCAATSVLINVCKIDSAGELKSMYDRRMHGLFIGGYDWEIVESFYDSLRIGEIYDYKWPFPNTRQDISFAALFDREPFIYTTTKPGVWYDDMCSWADAIDKLL